MLNVEICLRVSSGEALVLRRGGSHSVMPHFLNLHVENMHYERTSFS